MRGEVLGYKDGVPVIIADGSKRFLARSGPNLPIGTKVDFIEDGEEAIDVFPVGSMPGEKKRVIAALLAFLLGWIGIDLFYLRNWSTAWTILVGYIVLNLVLRQLGPASALLLITQLGFVGAGWIRAAMYLSKEQRDFAQQYAVNEGANSNA